jgi:cytochrome oxidase Cu insertion factor (SCO1/SenC/PrrC family)
MPRPCRIRTILASILLLLGAYTLARAEAAEVKRIDPRDLEIGKKAPEIEGQDVDGKKFKLSDYRGKVVVLDFWGDW